MAWDSGLFIFQLVPNHIGVIIASPLNKIKYLPGTGPYPVLLSLIHILLGAVLGALLASQLNNLMPIIGAFLDGAALPVAIEPLQVIVIALVAMVLALLSTLYPSWRAAATQPAEALRYE